MSRFLGLLLFLLAPASTLACDSASLFALVAERLSYMPAVAEYKYHHGLQVSDSAREQRVLESSAAQAQDLGLPADRVLPFMRAQMEAAKVIQRQLLEQWQQSGRRDGGDVGDLIATIRPQLNRLGREQLLEMQCLRERNLQIGDDQRADFDLALSKIPLPTVVTDDLFRSLQFVSGR